MELQSIKKKKPLQVTMSKEEEAIIRRATAIKSLSISAFLRTNSLGVAKKIINEDVEVKNS